MCKCNVLHSDTSGYVAYCPDCKHMQLAFDTFSLNLLEDDFENFYLSISEELNKNYDYIETDKRNFVYKLGPSSFRLIFSFNDLQRLHDLLSPARIIYRFFEITSNNI